MVPEGDANEAPRRREAVTVRVSSDGVGTPLHISVVDAKGREGVAVTAGVLSPAERQPMSFASLAKAVGQLGGTPFEVGELNVDGLHLDEEGGNNLFIAAGEIKAARRDAVDALVQVRRDSGKETAEGLAEGPTLPAMLEAAWWGNINDGSTSDSSQKKMRAAAPATTPTTASTTTTADNHTAAVAMMEEDDEPPGLSILCRTREQAEAALTIPWLTEVVLDFLVRFSTRK